MLVRGFCLLVGALLLIEDGLVGLVVAGTDFGVGDDLPHKGWNFFFEFNSWHHLLHIGTGGLLLAAGLTRKRMAESIFVFGAIYAVMTPFAFADGNDFANLIYSSQRENWVHASLAVEGIALGLVANAFGLLGRARRRTSESDLGAPPVVHAEQS